jgi:alpha-beta hydrolase superfamily lysophospholipase
MYVHEDVWRELQAFLPEKNRLGSNNLPVERFITTQGIRVHIDEYRQNSDTTIVVFHGVGGNGRIVSFIAVPLSRAGYNVICPDLPGYGFTENHKNVRYDDWIDVGVSVVDGELRKSRNVFLIGLSAGGMLAYNVSCKVRRVSGLIVTNILDNREEEVRMYSAKSAFQAKYGIRILNLLPESIRGFRIPIRMATNMTRLVNNEKALKLLLKDKRGAGSKVDLNFLMSMMNSHPEVEPEKYNHIPVLMVHPADDRWTPVKASDIFFNKIASEKKRVMLDNAGHFPMEEPGLSQMEHAIMDFIEKFSL